MKSKKTALIIEDTIGFRMCYREAMEHHGFEVLEAEDGEKGWELARTQNPTIILLDLMLPRLHGFEVLKKIRANHATKDIPVFILSVMDDPQSKRIGLELGANDFIVKGVDSPDKIAKLAGGILVQASGEKK